MSETDAAARAAAERAEARGEKRRDRWNAFLMLVLGALVTLGTTTVTNWQANSAAQQSQKAGFQEERSKEDREAKKTAYMTFLEKADSYAIATARVKGCLADATVRGRTEPEKVIRIDGDCGAKVAALAPARHDFQGARNAVFIYGSVEAEAQAKKIAAYLPAGVTSDVESGMPHLDGDFWAFDYAGTFNELWKGFNSIVRCDIPAEPVEGCGS